MQEALARELFRLERATR